MQIEIYPKHYFHSVSQFKLLQDIGVGSFGKVKLAIHRGTRKKYAIKIIDLSANLTPTQIQLISREVKVHSKLDHPHIIKLWDTLLEEQKIYMIMDYAQNGSLFNYQTMLLKQGKQPTISQIYQFFYQTLQAVKYLHNNDIMHRDIKPENLLLDQDLNVKLCDFGWATSQITSPRTTFCGTYEYMAPQMALQKSYDFRIDIWALGILLYELVHGKAPFQAQSLKIMKQRINKGSYQINSQCSSLLKDLIVDILQFMPQKRLSIKEIQNNIWIKNCQNINLDCGVGLVDQIMNITQQLHLKKDKERKKQKQGLLIQNLNKVKKHQHQRSMGNFIIQSHKHKYDQLADDENDIPNFNSKNKKTIHPQPQSRNISPVIDYKEDFIKKHKRNVTQPLDMVHQKLQQTHPRSNMISQKMQVVFGSLQTQADTPHQNNQTIKIKDGKQKKKCKTLIGDEFSLQTRWGGQSKSKKNLNQLQQIQQSVQLKKKRSHMRTETGPVIYTNSLSHVRNFSSSQLKQNQTMKKKIKNNQKVNTKIKKIQKTQTKSIDMAGKYSSDKIKNGKIYVV